MGLRTAGRPLLTFLAHTHHAPQNSIADASTSPRFQDFQLRSKLYAHQIKTTIISTSTAMADQQYPNGGYPGLPPQGGPDFLQLLHFHGVLHQQNIYLQQQIGMLQHGNNQLWQQNAHLQNQVNMHQHWVQQLNFLIEQEVAARGGHGGQGGMVAPGGQAGHGEEDGGEDQEDQDEGEEEMGGAQFGADQARIAQELERREQELQLREERVQQRENAVAQREARVAREEAAAEGNGNGDDEHEGEGAAGDGEGGERGDAGESESTAGEGDGSV